MQYRNITYITCPNLSMKSFLVSEREKAIFTLVFSSHFVIRTQLFIS